MYGIAALVVGGLAVLAVVAVRANRSPLSVGSTADEAWSYVHSPAAWQSGGKFLGITRSGWSAHALDIQCDMKYYLKVGTNRYVFVTRHVMYLLGTNSVIIGMQSSNKWRWPF